MEQDINDFEIPYYITEEITEYIEQTESGKCKCMKWENIKMLLRMAVINKRITNEQSKIIEMKYCREK